ncbi:MAG: hypothetical protein U5R49_19035 [Deltaproteobacteria bacterium]|nr:hypothetical protein [Deltaproteobacteria bacterium]
MKFGLISTNLENQYFYKKILPQKGCGGKLKGQYSRIGPTARKSLNSSQIETNFSVNMASRGGVIIAIQGAEFRCE